MVIRKGFNGGMDRDRDELTPSETTYYEAWNAIHESERSAGIFTNEQGNELFATIPGDIVGWTYIEQRHKTLVFSNSGGSSLYLLHHATGEVEFVASDSEFGCNWEFAKCERLYGEIKRHNVCDELFVYWSSGCTYHVLNIDEMLDPVRKSNIQATEDCTYFDLFNCICGPTMSATPVDFSGGATEVGAVSFAVQLEDRAGNQTNWLDISGVVYLTSENNIPGEPAEGAAKLTLDGLDIRYDRVNIAVIKTSAGVTTVELVDTMSYSEKGITYIYYGQKGTPLNLATVTTKNKAYLRGQDLKQKDGQLLFYNLKNEKNLNYQKYANEITPSLVEYEVSLEAQLKYSFTSLMRGEAYAPAIVWKYCDGTYSNAFPIFAQNAPAASGGGSSEDPGYVEFAASDLNTDDQHERIRNPGEDQTGDQSEAYEESVGTNIEDFQTTEQDVKDAADCLNCPAADNAVDQDLDTYLSPARNWNDLLAQYGVDTDPDDTTVGNTMSLQESAAKLYEDAVVNREYEESTRPVFTTSGAIPPGETILALGNVNSSGKRADNWVDANGKVLTEETPRFVQEHPIHAYESSVAYPNIRDCDGERMFPEGDMRLPKVPTTSEIPHFVSYTNGVINKFQPENYEYGKTYIRLLGFKFDNIHIPTEDELPKPLCPTSPFKIVYVKRTDQNKSVLAKGWLSGTFDGECNGVTHAFPRLGVNSFETVDRHITADGGSSRLGTQTPGATTYTFHSPDTDVDKSFLPVTHVRAELSLRGNGWRYGLYAKGREPIDDQWSGTRKDQRGARVANNLNHYTSAGGNDISCSGAIYAPANSTVTNPSGISKPLMNKYRESSVYLETAGVLPGSALDESFVGDVLDHFAPTKATAPYVALIRQIPDQYGDVFGMRFSDFGLEARAFHLEEGTTAIQGIAGDSWIGPYSKRRTAWVSDKIGDYFNVPNKPGSPCRKRAISESPDDMIQNFFGVNQYATRLPISGDKYDPKNYSGLHTVSGTCGEFGLSRQAGAAAAQGQSESDFYFPQVVKSLVHCIVETHIQPDKRMTGRGSQKIEGKVFYPNLKDLHLDSDSDGVHPYEDAYLNRFSCLIEQPSRKQLAKKAMVNAMLKLIFPGLMLTRFDNLESFIDTTGAMLTMPALLALWAVAKSTLFSNAKLDNLFGISGLKRDSEGGNLDQCVEGFEDNYNRYNWDYSKLSDEMPHYSIPPDYNTCDCSDCDGGDEYGNGRQLNNEIYASTKQHPDTEIDAYRNVLINSFQELPVHAGNLRKLFIENGNLYALTSQGVWLLRVAPGQFGNDIGGQYTGAGEFVVDPVLLNEGSEEGFMGTNYPNSIVTIAGYGTIIVDDIGKKVYRFSGQPEEISAFGMRGFFRDHLPFCNPQECFDEKEGQDYNIGFDPHHRRLLFTKKDASASFTASFDPIGKKWISFHDYIPDGYIWDRGNMFSIVGNQVWKHNVEGLYGNFYGSQYDFSVQTSVTDNDFRVFELASLGIAGFVRSGDIRGLDSFATSMAVWNDQQSTGMLNTLLISDNAGARNSQMSRATYTSCEIEMKKEQGLWRVNRIMDLVDQNCSEVATTLSSPCSLNAPLNQGIIDPLLPNSQNYRNRIFSGLHLNFKLVFANKTNEEVKLLYVDVMTNTPANKKQ